MKPARPDAWAALRRHTPARVALGRAGVSLPTREVLAFGLAHARARDAVHETLDVEQLCSRLADLGFSPALARSRAADRATYLTRPDLGRHLADEVALSGEAEIAVAIEDGLSAVAVQRHAVPLLEALVALDECWKRAAVVIATQGRVALGDEIGERLKARLVVVLIGERPGLSSPDSLGVYLTYAPRPGRSDAERNCISNIRPEGLSYADAARSLDWLAKAALARGMTGVALKNDSGGELAPP
ncbi:MAG: ethanolamine ammonia-lyase subunit EutC [Clostridia bacterium]